MTPPSSVAWPTHEQELLLRAALAHGDEAVATWERWAALVELDDVDAGSHRLLPLLYRTLADAGVDPERIAKLKGVYRHWWYRNNVVLHSATRALAVLGEAGFETVILKGSALGRRYYGDVGARPMNDVDLLVRRERAFDAIDALRSAGWRPEIEPTATLLSVSHGCHLVGPNGHELDLHWDVLWQLPGNADFWERSVETSLNGVSTRALCHADQLLHVCAHGVRWSPIEPIRWVADACRIVEVAGAELDWDRVVATASEARLSLALEAALGYIRDRLDAPVPPETLAALGAVPASPFERLVFRTALGRQNRVKLALLLWDRHRRLVRTGAGDEETASFAEFLRRHWGLDRLSQVPSHGLRKLGPIRWR